MPIYDHDAYDSLVQHYNATELSFHGLSNATRKSFRVLRKKLELYRLFDSKYVVAFTGLQGAGKTTLMQTLYGMEMKKYLPADINRGERISILIRESHEAEKKGSPIFLAYSNVSSDVDKDTSLTGLRRRDIDGETFYKIAENPGEEDLILELQLPPRYGFGEQFAFAMLPGAELTDSEWQELMESTVHAASRHVFVVNHFGITDGHSMDRLKHILNLAEGAAPVVMITHTDEVSDEKMKDASKNLLERFPELENRLVLLAGQYRGDATRTSGWVDAFISELKSFQGSEELVRDRRAGHLRMIVQDEVQDRIGEIDELLTEWKTRIGGNQYEYETFLEGFQSTKVRIKAHFTAEVRKYVLTQYENSRKNAIRDLHRKYGQRLVEKLKQMVGNGETSTEFREDVIRCWGESDPKSSREMNANIMKNAYLQLPVIAKDDQADLYWPSQIERDEEVMLSLQYLGKVIAKRGSKEEPPKHLQEAINITPYIAIYLMLYGAETCSRMNLEKREERLSADDLKKTLENMEGNLGSHISSATGILKASALYLGLDIALDGTLDLSIPEFSAGLAKALGASGATAKFMTMALNYAAAGFVGFSLFSTFAIDALRYEEGRQLAIDKLFKDIYEHIINKYEERFEEVFSLLESDIKYALGIIHDFDGEKSQYLKAVGTAKLLREDRRTALNSLAMGKR